MEDKKSKFLKLYLNEAVNTIVRTHPEWDEDKVKGIVKKKMDESFSNPDVIIDNNYTRQTSDSKLLTIVDWYLERKPILAGNGTFFKRQDESINPIGDMLTWFLDTRQTVKTQMFSYDESSQEYLLKDIEQGVWKVNSNSYYGGAAMPSSPFYNKYCAASITSTAQSVISTCYSTFEAFLTDNFLFYNINECIDWLNTVLSQIQKDSFTDEWLTIKTKEDVYNKLREMFVEWKESYARLLMDFLDTLSPIELSRIYYRNRFNEFTQDHDNIKKMHNKIMQEIKVYPTLKKQQIKQNNWEDYIPENMRGKFKSSKEYNKFAATESFMNPNKIPDSIKDDLSQLSDYYMKYVYTQYMVFDRIYRLKNFKRKTVVIIDTDSNILALDGYVEFIRSILESTDKSEENEEFIIINTIAYILTRVITDTLLRYEELMNVPEEFRSIYEMKNEYFMNRLIVPCVKKRYISLIKLREGNIFDPPKIDIKGFDFIKSGASDNCEERFTDIIKRRMLLTDKIDVVAIREELREMENDVYQSIRSGNLEYLPNATIKDLSSYADPGSEQSVRGMLSWNYIYPDSPIEILSKVKILKLVLLREEDMLPLKDVYPEIYDIVIDKIFNDKSGIFVTEKINKGKIKRHVKGFQVIAIPQHEKIPDWCIPYIDYNSVVSAIMAPFKSITDMLKINCVSTGFSINGINRHNENFTNIINF